MGLNLSGYKRVVDYHSPGYDYLPDVESVRDVGRYSGDIEDQMQKMSCQFQVQQEDLQREMHEIFLDLPCMIAQTCFMKEKRLEGELFSAADFTGPH
ncbi:UNVERIFIED_CONTAM: hypothetical protein K2H54_038846 [Gekko kuhli]